MSEYELHSLIADLLRDMDHMLEFWLSGTFAVIVARFYGADRLSRRAHWLIAFLYLVASSVASTRYGLAFARRGDYQRELVSVGFEPFFQPAVLTTTMSVVMWIFGIAVTVGTVYFILSRRPAILSAPTKGEVSPG